jgi:hypothetical protein
MDDRGRMLDFAVEADDGRLAVPDRRVRQKLQRLAYQEVA